jgi:hypothetical protein
MDGWMITSRTIMDGREHPTGWMMMEASKGKSGFLWRWLWFLDLRFCACRHGRAATACPRNSLELTCLSSSSLPSSHLLRLLLCLSLVLVCCSSSSTWLGVSNCPSPLFASKICVFWLVFPVLI